jgi:DNA polymerase-3 subunit gamma/tau
MSLYQKYRPQEFDSLAGQEHIKKTLKAALMRDLVSHAYLFCGPRGTGKTTTARLLAKSLNCPNFDMSTGDPCNKCDICESITNSSLIDVIEIDAASNRGIDEIRELKETIRFAPTLAKNKVYIIDEVHMLTNEAFNALLKTLEEPPENVFFILATTEAHKIPETIMSRCQRFDFRRISNLDLINRLKFIAEAEKIEYEESALEMISIYSDGGMRDSISIMDQLAVSGKITADETKRLLGSTGIDTLYGFLEALFSQNDQKAFEIINSLHEQGSDIKQFQNQILKICRDKLHIAIDKNDLAEKSRLVNLIDVWQEIQNNFKTNIVPELPLEILVVKFCNQLHVPVATLAPAPNYVPVEPQIVVAEEPVAKIEAVVAPVVSVASVDSVEKSISEVPDTPEEVRPSPKIEDGLKNLPAEAPVSLGETGGSKACADEVKPAPSKRVVSKADAGAIQQEEVDRVNLVAKDKADIAAKFQNSDIEKDWKRLVENVSVISLRRLLKNGKYQQISETEGVVSVHSNFEFEILKKAENIHAVEKLIEDYCGKRVQISVKIEKIDLEALAAKKAEIEANPLPKLDQAVPMAMSDFDPSFAPAEPMGAAAASGGGMGADEFDAFNMFDGQFED